ncbi:hypothetical protein KY304_00680 [Candidatus Woesearchaeota archaeon]|nr:hypothetical protein [Candidatus Woesearchaeota archaeon]
MDEKNIPYLVLAAVLVISIFGLSSMFKTETTGQVPVMTSKLYGGAVKGIEMPYYEDRVVLVNKGNSVDVIDISKAQTNRIPSQSALENREPSRASALLDSCEGLIIQDQLPAGYTYEAGWTEAVNRYGMHNCKDMTSWIGQWCCKRD